MEAPLDNLIDVLGMNSSDGWRPQVTWVNIAVNGVTAFKIPPELCSSPTDYVAVIISLLILPLSPEYMMPWSNNQNQRTLMQLSKLNWTRICSKNQKKTKLSKTAWCLRRKRYHVNYTVWLYLPNAEIIRFAYILILKLRCYYHCCCHCLIIRHCVSRTTFHDFHCYFLVSIISQEHDSSSTDHSYGEIDA